MKDFDIGWKLNSTSKELEQPKNILNVRVEFVKNGISLSQP
jgi:hypothetical protein